jgi:hypothetical protein
MPTMNRIIIISNFFITDLYSCIELELCGSRRVSNFSRRFIALVATNVNTVEVLKAASLHCLPIIVLKNEMEYRTPLIYI